MEKPTEILKTSQELVKNTEGDEWNFSPEDEKAYEQLLQGARNVIKNFSLKRSPDNTKGETLRIVVDAGVDQVMLKALYDAGRETAGNDCRLVVVPKTEKPATPLGEAVGQAMQTADAVLLFTSLSRTHAKETSEVLYPSYDDKLIQQLLETDHFPVIGKYLLPELKAKMGERRKKLKYPDDREVVFPSQGRIISITTSRREILSEGAALEDPVEMIEKMKKFGEVMEDVERVTITSFNGTNIEVDIKKTGAVFGETGIIDKPGKASNFPSGEYCGGVDLANTNGTYVVDGCATVINRYDEEPNERLDKKPIRLTVKNGVVVDIEGGEAAGWLKAKLEEENKKWEREYPLGILKKNLGALNKKGTTVSEDQIEKMTTEEILDLLRRENIPFNENYRKMSAFNLAEIAFGMNSKAFRYENGEKVAAPVLLEAEKGEGTVHVAVGKNTTFAPKDDPEYNEIPIHIDLVAMKPLVTGIKKDGSRVELVRDGKIICL